MRRSAAPLREREFRLYFAGRTISLVGSAIAPVALAFAILDLTGSKTDLGLILAAREIPLLLFLLVGGIWADRGRSPVHRRQGGEVPDLRLACDQERGGGGLRDCADDVRAHHHLVPRQAAAIAVAVTLPVFAVREVRTLERRHAGA